MKNLRKAARGRECAVRIPGVCNHNPETTVLAHIRRGGVGGVGMKPSDLCAVLACSACHDIIDGRVRRWDLFGNNEDMYLLQNYILEALCRTLQVWTDEGLV